MTVKVEKELDMDLHDAVSVLKQVLKVTNLVENNSSLTVITDKSTGEKVLYDKRTKSPVNGSEKDFGRVFEAFMYFLTTLNETPTPEYWEYIDDWIPIAVAKPSERSEYDYYMCTLKLPGDTCPVIKPCWYNDGSFWYGSTDVNEYVLAWRPNLAPYSPAP